MNALPLRLLRRFDVIRELGRGGGGIVYLVDDLVEGPPPRALKVVRGAHTDPRKTLLRREFDALRQLRHPGLVPVFDFGWERGGDLLWFTSEFVPGPDLFEASAHWGSSELQAVAARLAETLQFLHDRGYSHNDIKLSNVRVPAGPETARLLDLGLTSRLAGGPVAGGTPPYMPPERLRKRGAPGSIRADLYGLGVALYACATRRLPFSGGEPADVLAAIESGAVPPRALRPEIPHHLEDVITKLIDPDPGGRYPGASELIRDLDRTPASDGGSGGGPAASHPDSTPLVASLPAPPLLGRETVLGRAREMWRRVEGGGGPAHLLIVGEAGIGKTRIISEILQELELSDAAVVRVRAHRGPPPAWALLRDIVKRLAAQPGSPGPPASLQSVERAAEDPAVPRPVRDFREALTSHVAACARTWPLALLVDDLGWGDADSVSAVLDLASEGAGARILLVASTRDEQPTAGIIGRWLAAGWPVERLAPLGDDLQRRLVESLFPGGGVGSDLIDAAIGEARGNPLALEEIARSWVEARAVRRVAGGWRTDPGVPVPLPRPPREIIAARLDSIPAAALAVVYRVALHGRPLPRAVVAGALPDGDHGLESALRERLLIETDEGVDVRHPLVRETAVERISAPEAPHIHRYLAETLERMGAMSAVLWKHFLAAGDYERGLHHALAAGLAATAIEEFHAARVALERVLGAPEAAAVLGPAGLAQARECLATCLIQIGDPAAAVPLLDAAIPAVSLAAAERLRITLGRALLRSSNYVRAESVLREVRSAATTVAILIEGGHWLAYALRTDRAKEAREICDSLLTHARELEADPEAAVLLCDFYLQAAFMEANCEGPAAGLSRVELALRAAERTGTATHLARARVVRGSLLNNAGRLREGLEDLAAAEPVLRRTSSARWRWLCRLRGEALHHGGNDAGALGSLGEALAAADTSEDTWNTRTVLAAVLADIGDPEALAEALAVVRAAGEGHRLNGIEMALGAGLRAMLWLGLRDEAESLRRTLAARELATVTPVDRPEFDAARGLLALLDGDAQGGVALLGEAVAGGTRFCPVLVPGYQVHLAYARELAGRLEGALSAASDAETGYLLLGDTTGAARARRLGSAIAEGLIKTPRSAAHWAARQVTAESIFRQAGEPRQKLVDAVTTAAAATGTWLVTGSGAATTVVARAGDCAAADPLAWRAAVAECLESRTAVRRAGVGVALPIAFGDERAVVVVEDRSYPQAFAPEAETFAELVAHRVLDGVDREQLVAALSAARRVLDRSATPPPMLARTAPTTPGRRPRRSQKASRLIELSLGPLELRHRFDEIVGRSRVMRRALRVLDRVVELDASVLVVGETGTGKELVARALHEQGGRAGGRFVAVNCSAIPPSLAESEFFGHVPGAFTGAGKAGHRGYFEQASGGTLFLDEIGELDNAMQAKLLRAIEEGEVRPLGSEKSVRVDVRLVAATHRDLRQEGEAGHFRRDLFFRIAVIEILLPPLRERPDDIPYLVAHLLDGLSTTRPVVSPEALDALCLYAWPGNVRELRNELERATAFCQSGTIRLENLSPTVRGSAHPVPRGPTPIRAAVEAFERRIVSEALRAAAGNKAQAARSLGLTRVGLHLMLRRLGLAPPAHGAHGKRGPAGPRGGRPAATRPRGARTRPSR